MLDWKRRRRSGLSTVPGELGGVFLTIFLNKLGQVATQANDADQREKLNMMDPEHRKLIETEMVTSCLKVKMSISKATRHQANKIAWSRMREWHHCAALMSFLEIWIVTYFFLAMALTGCSLSLLKHSWFNQPIALPKTYRATRSVSERCSGTRCLDRWLLRHTQSVGDAEK